MHSFGDVDYESIGFLKDSSECTGNRLNLQAKYMLS